MKATIYAVMGIPNSDIQYRYTARGELIRVFDTRVAAEELAETLNSKKKWYKAWVEETQIG